MGLVSKQPRLTWWRTGSSSHGCWIGWYEREVQQALLSVLRRGAVLYDVGANAGFFTLLAAQLVGPKGRVIAFEPEPVNLEKLRYHVTRNSAANVTVLGAAVSDREGIAMLGGTGAAASLGSDVGVQVTTVTIDGLVGDGKIPPPDVVKIDVEGWEFPVLNGMNHTLKTFRPVLLIEFHGALRHGIDWDTACRKSLIELGYLIVRMRSGETIAVPPGHHAERWLANCAASA